jgi:hypothetical protein
MLCLTLVLSVLLTQSTSTSTVISRSGHGQCKCVRLSVRVLLPAIDQVQSPRDACWPEAHVWTQFNKTLSGQLIKTEPLALPCYPGLHHDESLCTLISTQWNNASFQADSPVGLSYPRDMSCPPLNVSVDEKAASCSLGASPVFAVNATTSAHVSWGIKFAKSHNIRLIIKSTGHDILARSEGYGSLEVWLRHNNRHLRTGVMFQETFPLTNGCKETNWTGSAFTIGGGHTWKDVIPEAKARNVVVVTGGTPSVSCVGGWMQGGGHGPASRQFGLGADQVLEAQLVLANGSIVTTNSCQNQDLFFAIRGGGPGTYGVVVSTTIKAWPMVNVTVQHLTITSLKNDSTQLLDAISIIYSAFPDLNDAGYAGYGSWSLATGYTHGLYMFDTSLRHAQNIFDTTLRKLTQYNGTALNISVSYLSYPDYWSFYAAESGIEPPVGTSYAALGSRLFDRKSMQNSSDVRKMISTIAGTPEEGTFNNLELVSGGRVFEDAIDPFSGVNHAWRTSYFSNIVSRGWNKNTDKATIDGIRNDITFVKTAAMRKLAPDTGAYMNEADRLDPEWERDFYGRHYEKLKRIKRRWDAAGVFYCPTCVGSSDWVEDGQGRLCRR